MTSDGYLTIGARGRASVGCIDEGTAFGDGDLEMLGARGEDARLTIDNGFVETIVGEWTAVVRPAGGWSCTEAIGMASIGGGSPRTTSDGLGIYKRDAVAALGVVEIKGVSVAVELHVDVVRCPDRVVIIEPEHCIAMGGDMCRIVDARLSGHVGIVAEETACHIDVG